jgi:predicted dehydrogenase
MASDDAAGLLLRFDGGARGVCTISQVSAGRRNRLAWEIDGDVSALAWASDDPDHLWIGYRGRPNELVEKDPALLTPEGAAAAAFPGGHVEGYADTFRALLTTVYADVEARAPAAEPRYPTFADGHAIMAVCDAVTNSASSGTWAKVERD